MFLWLQNYNHLRMVLKTCHRKVATGGSEAIYRYKMTQSASNSLVWRGFDAEFYGYPVIRNSLKGINIICSLLYQHQHPTHIFVLIARDSTIHHTYIAHAWAQAMKSNKS